MEEAHYPSAVASDLGDDVAPVEAAGQRLENGNYAGCAIRSTHRAKRAFCHRGNQREKRARPFPPCCGSKPVRPLTDCLKRLILQI